jgi:WXG100 family type VII secretion target
MSTGGSIQVTYEDLERASQTFNSELGELMNLLNKIQGTINSVAGVSWVSAAQAQFSTDIANLNKSATGIQQAGTSLANFLNTAAKTYQETDSSLQKALGQS